MVRIATDDGERLRLRRTGPFASLRVCLRQIGLVAPILLEAGALAALLVLALRFRLANPQHYTGSFDEGVRMEQLLLMEHGYRPYREIFASQGPLLLDLLYPLYQVFGGTLGAARLGVGLLSLVGLLGAWWAGRALGRPAGLGAAALLVVSPAYLEGSRLALAEVPSLAPCLWAVGCGLRWQRGRAAGWLYGAAALAVLGVLVKPMALPVGVPIALSAALRRPPRTRPLVVAGLLGLALVALVLLALGPARVFEVLGGYRLGAQRPAGLSAGQNWSLIAKIVGAGERNGFLALAAAGLGLGLLHWPRATLALAAWPLAQLALFLVYTDLADKHVVYLVPPLALLGGLTFAAPARSMGGLSASGLRSAPAAGSVRRIISGPLPTALVALAAVGIYAANLTPLWRADRDLLHDDAERAHRDYAGTEEQAALMAALTLPTDFVLTDNPIAAFQARRLVPPWLVDTSGTRVDAGSLTSDTVIREAGRYEPKVIVTSRRRLGKLEGFNRWLASNYRPIKTYPGSDPSAPLQLYVRPDLEEQTRSYLAGRP
jgi:hypothetical protein